MIERTKSAVARTAYKKRLATPVPYSYKWSDYEGISEVDAANDRLTDAEVVKTRNTEHEQKSRQASLKAALDKAGIVKPTFENDDQIRLRDFCKVLLSAKDKQGNPLYTEQQARDLASEKLQIEWDDEDDE